LNPISKSPQDLSSAKERRAILGNNQWILAPIKGHRVARGEGPKRKEEKIESNRLINKQKAEGGETEQKRKKRSRKE
jgi:hypothetical protein